MEESNLLLPKNASVLIKVFSYEGISTSLNSIMLEGRYTSSREK